MENLIDENVTLKDIQTKDSNWIRMGTLIENSIIGNNIFINFRCTISNSIIEDYVIASIV